MLHCTRLHFFTGLSLLCAALSPGWAQAQVAEGTKVEKKSVWEEKKDDLEKKMAKALSREPRRAGELESTCGGWHSPKVLAVDPLLAPRLKICAGIAAVMREQTAVARNRFKEAISLASQVGSDHARDVEAEALFQLAELNETLMSSFETCGTRLGLVGMRTYEAELLRQSRSSIDKKYKEILAVGSKKWTSIALFRLATRADDFYQKNAFGTAMTYRGIDFPSPHSVEKLELTGFEPTVSGTMGKKWPREILRLFKISLERAEKDGAPMEIRTAIRNRIANLEQEKAHPVLKVENPWILTAPAGTIRYRAKTFETRREDGTWVPMKSKRARSLINKQLTSKAEPGALFGFALVALAESAPKKVTAEMIETALKSPLPQVRFAAYRAIEVRPIKSTYDSLLANWKVEIPSDYRNREAFHKRFSTLDRALFGLEERLLLALRALVTKERSLAHKVAKESKYLPRNERAWVLAELGDTRFQYRYQELIENGGQEARAIALYGLHHAIGDRSKWLLYKHKYGVAGCVGSNLLRWEKQKEKRIQLDPLAE